VSCQITAPTASDQHRQSTEPGRKRKGRLSFWGYCRRLIWAWWFWTLIVIASAYTSHWQTAMWTLLAAIVTYLVTPPTVSPTYGLESTTPIESEEFLSTITGATGVPFLEGNRIAFLNNGDQFYPAMLKAIGGARNSITVEAYIYWAGKIGQRFADAIAERSRAGVEVKILLDAVGSSTIGKEILNTLQSSGCQVRWYNKMFWRTIGRFNNRTHRKSLIIDGRLAFTGGAGIADHWSGNAENPEHWRDIQIRLDGPGVVPLQTGFVQNWLATTGEIVTGPRYFPKPEPAGPIAVQTIISSPAGGSSAVRTMYYLSIVSAQRTLYIANAYFIPDESGVDILVSARKRGVDVKLMLAGIHNDMKLARYGGIHLYGKLLEAGIEIYEYNQTMLHQKTMVVDGAWITIGTTNFDNRSFALHEESNVCIYNTDLARRLEQIFFEDLSACDRITLEEWKRRGILTKIRGAAALFLKDQL
jgi:cardiolipin synthase